MNIQKIANIEARNRNCGLVTSIKFSPVLSSPKVNHVSFKYRTYTTSKYVPNAPRTKCKRKNTNYQYTETIVYFPLWVGWLAGEDL